MIRDGKLLDTPDWRSDGHRFYSSSGSDRDYDCHHYHPYRRSDWAYFLDEFKKAKPPTFNGDLKKLEDAEAWLLGMKKFFELHEYIENMKDKISIFSVKVKEDICWEDVKQFRDIRTKELSWHDVKILFRNKYLLERYYENKAKEFYKLKMGSMTDEEYMTKFLELMRYVPYIKDEKDKVHRFVGGFPLVFRD